jgi:hypothetical protein
LRAWANVMERLWVLAPLALKQDQPETAQLGRFQTPKNIATRLRVGGAYDRLLFYVTGGGGWGQFSMNISTFGGGALNTSQWHSPTSLAPALNTASRRICRPAPSTFMSIPAMFNC